MAVTTLNIGGQNYQVPVSYVFLSLVVVAIGILTTTFNIVSGNTKGGIPFKSGLPIVGSWAFFTKRHRFTDEGLKRLGKIFSFNLLHHTVVVVSGEEARKTYFSHKNLDLSQGYLVLFGGAPTLKEISIEKGDGQGVTWFGKRLTAVLRRDRLAITLPKMFQDLERRMEAWGTKGSFNPFEDIYNIVFQLTIRAGSCTEIADDPKAVQRVMELYWNMENGSTPSSVLLPWFPSKARNLKNNSTMELYGILKHHVEDRQKTGRTETDPMQVLLDEGDSTNDVVQFVMATLFAGIINTGIMSSWITLYLHANPTWKAKAIAEVESFIAKYATEGASLVQQLSQVPPEVWDEEMPVLDLCLRETIRIVMTGSLLRRNVGDSIDFDGHKVSPGTFVAMPVASVHHNPDIYPDPHTWDPDRYTREEDKKGQMAYVGWGAGRHPCLGMRLAKLEVKVILALFLTRYEYELVDKSGAKVTTLPPPQRDNLYQVPPTKPVYIKYTRVSA